MPLRPSQVSSFAGGTFFGGERGEEREPPPAKLGILVIAVLVVSQLNQEKIFNVV